MPFFEFKCEKCGHTFEKRISNVDKDKVKCPQCGHPKVKQLFSVFYAPSGRSGPAVKPAAPEGCSGCAKANFG